MILRRDDRILPGRDPKRVHVCLGDLECSQPLIGSDGRDEALTSGGSEERPWEVEGAKWSPDGLRLAVTREDFRGVNRVPLIHWLKPVEEVEWRWFTKAGGPLPKVELHVVDAISHRTVPVDLGPDPEPYLSIVGFTPDGGTLLVLANSR